MTWAPVSDDEFAEICAGMREAEESGLFDGMFKGESQSNTQSINKEAFLAQMYAGMHLYRSTFKKIYGFELSYPGFADQAISRLEDLGCKKARDYYEAVRAEIDEQHDQDMKNAAAWYADECKRHQEKEQKGGRRERARQQQTQWQQSGRERWMEMSEVLGFQLIAKER